MKKCKVTQIFVFLLVLAGCSGVPDFGTSTLDLFDSETDTTTITLTVDENLNPDASGRPSPLVLRVYQLNNDAQFKSLDFTTLYEQDTSVLGVDLRKQDQVTLFPGNSITYNLKVFTDAQFLAFLGAYQNETQSRPKLIISIQDGVPNDICVNVGSISLSVTEDC